MTLKNLLLGLDNTGSGGIDTANEPGNQLGGFDFRWQSPLFTAPYAVYGQFIGEDEAGGLPSKYIGMAGIETWGAWGREGASWRLHAEYADTAVDSFFGSEPLFNTVYRHHTYFNGYTYRDRIIGHALGGDGRMASLGLLYATAGGKTWDILLRRSEPERDVAASPAYLGAELGHRLFWRDHAISVRAGVVRRQAPGGNSDEGQLDVQWERRF